MRPFGFFKQAILDVYFLLLELLTGIILTHCKVCTQLNVGKVNSYMHSNRAKM